MSENTVSKFGTPSKEKKTELVNNSVLQNTKNPTNFAFSVLNGIRCLLGEKIVV